MSHACCNLSSFSFFVLLLSFPLIFIYLFNSYFVFSQVTAERLFIEEYLIA